MRHIIKRGIAELRTIRDEFKLQLGDTPGVEAVSISKNEQLELVLAVHVRDHFFNSVKLPASFRDMPVVKQRTSDIYAN